MGQKKKKQHAPAKQKGHKGKGGQSSSSSSAASSCRHRGQACLSSSSRAAIEGCAVSGCEETSCLRACLNCGNLSMQHHTTFFLYSLFPGLQACKPHSKRHWAKNHGHALCFELATSKVFCWDCDMFYSGDELDDNVAKAIANLEKPEATNENSSSSSSSGAGSSSGVVILHGKPGNGLVNLGNSCFMNSVLQALAYLPEMKAFLGEGEVASGPLGKALLSTLRGIWSGKAGGRFSPAELHKLVKSSFAQFRRGTQEDAHEFFRAIIDAIDMEQKNSFVRDLFHLTTTSVVTCHGCASSFSRLEDGFDWSLSWQEKKMPPLPPAPARASGKKGKKQRRQAQADVVALAQEEEEEETAEALELVTLQWPSFGGKKFPLFRDAEFPRFLEEEESNEKTVNAQIVARADLAAGRYDARRSSIGGAFKMLQIFTDPEVLCGSNK